MRVTIHDGSEDFTGTKVKCNYVICAGQLFGFGQLENKSKLEKEYNIIKYFKKTSTSFLRFNLFASNLLITGKNMVAKISLSDKVAVTFSVKNAFLSKVSNHFVIDDEVAKEIRPLLTKYRIPFRTSTILKRNSIFLKKNLKIVVYEE